MLVIIIFLTLLFIDFIVLKLIKNKKISATKLAEYFTIYGVIVGALIYFDLAPKTVKIEKTKNLKICSLVAYEKVSRKGRSGLSLSSCPDFYFSAYIANIGELPVTKPVFRFKLENKPIGFNESNQLKAYIYNGLNTIISEPKNFNWLSDTSGNCYIAQTEEDDYYQITLPPLLINESVSIIVGYNNKMLNKTCLDTLVDGILETQVVEMGTFKPAWGNKEKNISDYEIKKQTKDLFLDSDKTEFLLMGGYYKSGNGF